MEDPRIAYLITRYFDGACTTAEKEELADWISHAQNDTVIREALEQAWQNYKPGEDIRTMATPALDRIQASLFNTAAASNNAEPKGQLRKLWRQLTAAAAVILLIVAGAWFWHHTKINRPPAAAAPIAYDIKPGGNKAVLTLAGGGRIILDSAANGTLAEQGNVKVEKLATGQLAYSSGKPGHNSKTVLYNTLSTPRGGQYQLTLPDGTKVWLNAASSLTYPTAFKGAQRKVSITGEAYFEVAQDKTHPFVVNKGGMDITVLGTHFNANTYDDEQDMKVTLLEGTVRVGQDGKTALLQPGQQAQVTQNKGKDIKVLSNVNLDEVVAWKNGSFYFERTGLGIVLRQLSRWYDVDIIYEGTVPDLPFGGEMGKDLSLAQVLKILEKMGVKCRLEGKKLIVSS